MRPTPTAAPVTGPFAEVLRAGRDQFNARFAEARRARPQLDETAFSLHLIENVTPIVNAAAAVRSGATSAVAQAAYAMSLELVALGLVGVTAADQLASRAWREVAPALAVHVAAQPRKVLAALTNAALYFSDFPGARGDEWLRRMRAAAPLAGTLDDALRIGQVIAWQCGLAHFRAGALESAAALPADAALAALGLGPSDTAESSRDAAIAALRADRWLAPSRGFSGQPGSLAKPQRVEIVRRAGGFRGFSGPFVTPPLIASDGERFFAQSDNGCWLLTADAHGAVFHRAAPHEFARAQAAGAGQPRPFTLVQGVVRVGALSARFPEIVTVASVAQTKDTLAVTTQVSHTIVLIAAVA